jgi:hypothetical protein
MGCCIATIFLVFGSRAAIVVWWLLDQPLFILAFRNWVLPGNFTLPAWVWPLLGVIFLPWTTLAYLFLFPGGIDGYKWIVIGLALLFDLAGHGGSYYHRDRISDFRGSQTTD